MDKCQCGNEMIEVGHDNGIQGAYWCAKCGRLYSYDVNDEYWHMPERLKERRIKEYEIKGWVIRDKNGWIYFEQIKPTKDEVNSDWEFNSLACQYLAFPKSWFPEVKWSDAAPTRVDLIIKEAK